MRKKSTNKKTKAKIESEYKVKQMQSHKKEEIIIFERNNNL
jgi:hypothetical protein